MVAHRGTIMLKTAAFIAAILFAAPALAGGPPQVINTVQDLSNACKAPDTDIAAFTCVIYLKGVEDASQAVGAAAMNHKGVLEVRVGLLDFAGCNLPHVLQVRAAFVAWAAKNPGKAKEAAAAGVLEIIHTEWPCEPAG
jgi:hypothetical protein